MKKILITGFQPFGEYTENSSELAAMNIRVVGPYAVEKIIFPVRIFGEPEDYGKYIIRRAKMVNARAIISLGMASSVYGLRIESQAVNWVDNPKYCLESEQGKVISPFFEKHQQLPVNLDSWDISKIMFGLESSGLAYEEEISQDAGAFCGNALMFRTLKLMQYEREIPYLFLHLPCTAEAVKNIPDFSKDKYITSLPLIAKILTIIMDSV